MQVFMKTMSDNSAVAVDIDDKFSKDGDYSQLDCDIGVTEGNSQNRFDDSSFNEHTNLFIGDLSRDCHEDHIHRLFSAYGTVVDIQIKRSKITKNPLGYGFVKMSSAEEANLCLEQIHEQEVCGRPIRVARAQRNSRLHVTNLDGMVTESELNAVFGAYGDVVEEDTIITRAECRSDAYALVHFLRREDAEDAKAALNGTYVKARAIYIDWNQNGLRRATGSMTSTGNSDVNVMNRAYSRPPDYPMPLYQECPVVSIYVRFEVVEDGRHITDQALHQVFQKFGRVTVVAIKSNVVDVDTNKENGYAFVHYESSQSGREAATRAVEAVQGLVSEGVVYTSEFSRNFRRGVSEDPTSPTLASTEPNSSNSSFEGSLANGSYGYGHTGGHSMMTMSGYPSLVNAAAAQSQSHMGMGMGMYGLGSQFMMPVGYQPAIGQTHGQLQYDQSDPSRFSTQQNMYHGHQQNMFPVPYPHYYVGSGRSVPVQMMHQQMPYSMPMGYGVDPLYMASPGHAYPSMMSNTSWTMSPQLMNGYPQMPSMGKYRGSSTSMPYSGGYMSESTSSAALSMDSSLTLPSSSMHMVGGDLYDAYNTHNNDL